MAATRAYFVPGWGYINEVKGNAYFVPGWGYVNETVSTTPPVRTFLPAWTRNSNLSSHAKVRR